MLKSGIRQERNIFTQQLSKGIYENILERDFQISKHHLISQRENKIMGYTIISE